MTDDYKSRCIQLAGITALVGNAVLALVKILLARRSGSLAVMGDGIDSSTDVLIAILTLVIGSVISRPSDREHPWGHGRAETTATLALSFIIFFAGAQLVLQSALKILGGVEVDEESFLAVVAALISIAGKGLLAATQYYYGRKANSDIVKANAQNMKNDIIMSAGVLVGLTLSTLLHCPVLDPVVALLVGLWIIKNAAVLFFDMNMELMDGNTDSTLYTKLFEAVAGVEGVTNPHGARIRKIASHWDIDLHIEASPSITLFDAHELSEKVEDAIREAISDVYTVTIHIEPEGSDSHQRTEEYGLSPDREC
jgi:cation diffusion facilitator family transporter